MCLLVPHKDRAKRNAMLRRLAADRKAAGLCSRCNSPRLPDDTRCEVHRDRQRIEERKK